MVERECRECVWWCGGGLVSRVSSRCILRDQSMTEPCSLPFKRHFPFGWIYKVQSTTVYESSPFAKKISLLLERTSHTLPPRQRSCSVLGFTSSELPNHMVPTTQRSIAIVSGNTFGEQGRLILHQFLVEHRI